MRKISKNNISKAVKRKQFPIGGIIMTLNNKVYDILKWVAMYFLPAIGTLYFAVAQIWGLPYGEEIVGTITAVDAFLGAILGISTSSYNGDGTLDIDTTSEEKDSYLLNISTPLDELPNKKTITLKVNSRSQE